VRGSWPFPPQGAGFDPELGPGEFGSGLGCQLAEPGERIAGIREAIGPAGRGQLRLELRERVPCFAGRGEASRTPPAPSAGAQSRVLARPRPGTATSTVAPASPS
jgi:hypothetical protein